MKKPTVKDYKGQKFNFDSPEARPILWYMVLMGSLSNGLYQRYLNYSEKDKNRMIDKIVLKIQEQS